MTKKIDLINSAYSKLRISGITVNPKGEEIGLALGELEDMMTELKGSGLCLGYNFEEAPDANTDAGLDRKFHNMVKTNVALRLIPDFNKVVPQTLLNQATQSLSAVSGMVALDNIRQVSAPSRMPIGSGHQIRSRYQRYNEPQPVPANNCDTNYLKIGDINDYLESFHAYLEGETITSFDITSTTGLSIESSSNTDETVSYRVEALSTTDIIQAATIKIATNTGRVTSRTIEFGICNAGATGACSGNNIAGQAIAGCAIAG